MEPDSTNKFEIPVKFLSEEEKEDIDCYRQSKKAVQANRSIRIIIFKNSGKISNWVNTAFTSQHNLQFYIHRRPKGLLFYTFHFPVFEMKRNSLRFPLFIDQNPHFMPVSTSDTKSDFQQKMQFINQNKGFRTEFRPFQKFVCKCLCSGFWIL